MSSARSASAITSLPKPGALTPAGVGRSIPATPGSASLVLARVESARAVAELDGVIAAFLSAELLANYGGRSPVRDRVETPSNRIVAQCTSGLGRPRSGGILPTLMIPGADARAVLRRH